MKTVSLVGIFRLLAFMLGVFLSFALVVIFDPASYSKYQFILSQVSIYAVILGIGIPNICGRRIPKTQSKICINIYTKFINTYNIFLIFILMICLAIILSSQTTEDNNFVYILLLGLATLTAAQKNILTLVYNRFHTLTYTVLSQLVRPLFLCLLVAYFYSYELNGSINIFLTFEAFILAVTMYLGYYALSENLFNIKISKRTFMRVLRYTLPLLIVMLLQTVQAKVPILVVGYFLNPIDAGNLMLALKVSSLVSIATLIAITSYGAELRKTIARQDVENASQIIQKVNQFILFYGIFFLIIFYSFGSQIILMLNNEYTRAFDFSILILISTIVGNVFFGVFYIFQHCIPVATVRNTFAILLLIKVLMLSVSTNYFHAEGFLVSYFITILIDNCTLNTLVKRHVGLDCLYRPNV